MKSILIPNTARLLIFSILLSTVQAPTIMAQEISDDSEIETAQNSQDAQTTDTESEDLTTQEEVTPTNESLASQEIAPTPKTESKDATDEIDQSVTKGPEPQKDSGVSGELEESVDSQSNENEEDAEDEGETEPRDEEQTKQYIILHKAPSSTSGKFFGTSSTSSTQKKQADAADAAKAIKKTQEEIIDDNAKILDEDEVLQLENLPIIVASLSEDQRKDILEDDNVEAVEENILHEASLEESIPIIGAGNVHTDGFTGSGQAIAILDTGVDAADGFITVGPEACFSDGFGHGKTLCPNAQTTQIGVGAAAPCTNLRSCSHGTHVAGIAAGNGTGVTFTGVAPESEVIAVQIFTEVDDRLYASTSDILSGLDYVLGLQSDPTYTKNIASVNLSLGGGLHDTYEECDRDFSATKAAIDRLRAAGIATVIASGNDSADDSISTPACISTAVAVGATDDDDEVAEYSNLSYAVDLLAPGSEVVSSTLDGFESYNGTSMAAPHVSGSWALLLQAHPTATIDEIQTALEQTGLSVYDADANLTLPRINVDGAHRYLASDVSTIEYSGFFKESAANDGSVNQAMTATISGGAVFAHTDDVLILDTDYTVTHLPAGLQLQISINSDGSEATLELTGSALTHDFDDDVEELRLTFTDSAFSNAPVDMVLNTLDINLGSIDFIQPRIEWNLRPIQERRAPYGEIYTYMNATLEDGEFVDYSFQMEQGRHYDVDNLPAGLDLSLSIYRSTIYIDIDGTATHHGSSSSIDNLTITIRDEAFKDLQATDVVSSQKDDIAVEFYDQAYITWNGQFTESAADDGSVEGTLTATLTGDTFENLSIDDEVYVDDYPWGLIPRVRVSSDRRQAFFTFDGKALNASADVHDVEFDFDEDAFEINDYYARDVINYRKRDVSILFKANYLYRFYSPAFKGHFFTTSAAERDHIIASDPNWTYEGIASKVLNANDTYARPIYRFWSSVFEHHFYTISAAEKDFLIASNPNWAYEGIAYYAYGSNDQSSTMPVYRFYSPVFKGHFYTASYQERDNLITNDPNWDYEGVAWHIPR